MRFIDKKGLKFNNLTVLYFLGKNKQSLNMWMCECVCGNKIAVVSGELKENKGKKSCGCKRVIDPNRKTREYGAWRDMIQRCTNKKVLSYKYYGARGIKVCDRWRSFDNFLLDMGFKPFKNYSLDRINNDGDYEPSNCIWSTFENQCKNRRDNRFLELNGLKMIMSDWCRLLNIKDQTLRCYLKRHTFKEAYEHYSSKKK